MSYIGGGMYDAKPCPKCGDTTWNGRCENHDCDYHWRPLEDDDPPVRSTSCEDVMNRLMGGRGE